MIHYLNGVEISPRNRESIGITCDFTGNPEILNVNVTELVLPREAKDIIEAHIQSVGLFEGIPYTVSLGGGITLDYYIDLTEGVKVRQNEIEAKIKRRNGLDSFFDKANGASFDWLRSEGVSYNVVDVPYVIIKDNQLELAISLAISSYILTKETIEQVKATAEAIADLVAVSTPIPGLSPTGPTVSYNVGGIIRQSIVVLIQLTYLALLLVALIKLAKDLFLLLFPPIRKLKGCSFKEIMDKSCGYFGYTFQSDLLTADPYWHICPVPLTRNRKSIFEFKPDQFTQAFNYGTPSSSDTVPTFGQFINSLETMFNARVIINNNVVRLERRDWLQNNATTQVETALAIQGDRDDEYTYNTEDIWKRYYIHYIPDFTDLHSCDGTTYDNHDAEYSTEPLFPVTNADLLNIKGLNDVAIPYSLGARKSKLNWLEAIGYGFFVAIDAVINLFGGSSSLASQIGQRKDVMQISQQFFATTKVLYGKVGEFRAGAVVQNSNYFDNISAKALWDKYHYINAIDQNDFLSYESVRLRLSQQDFYNILSNNYVTINGVTGCEILKLTWIDEKSYAEITYRVPNDWANGKTNVIRIN